VSLRALDAATGEIIEKTLEHAGNELKRFYSALEARFLLGGPEGNIQPRLETSKTGSRGVDWGEI